MRWAIVIGIDEYGPGLTRLHASVSDALAFRDWLLLPEGGAVPPSNVRLLLGRRADDHARGDGEVVATKDNIVAAINEVVLSAGEKAERLYFYFAGHGILARVANRDESALVTPGFDPLHTGHSLAIRSLTEYFETTPFADQFFFLDACRDEPWPDREFEIGRWPLPRRRDPGVPPVQQFILYATAAGRKAEEVGFPDESKGAFSSVLMQGLDGCEHAKAWSWERNRYEVRWEGLANFVSEQMKQRAEVPLERWPVQIPQDTGIRGVAERDRSRDAVVVSFSHGRFPNLKLTVQLEPAEDYEAGIGAEEYEAEIDVVDAVAAPVASALKATGTSHVFTLPPKTYAVLVHTTTPAGLVGTLTAPVDLYKDDAVPVKLRVDQETRPGGRHSEELEPGDLPASGEVEREGVIAIRSADPLALAEIRDEAGGVVKLATAGEGVPAKRGFYRLRHVGPEDPTRPEEARVGLVGVNGRAPETSAFVVLGPGESEEVLLRPPDLTPRAKAVAEALGGQVEDGCVRVPGAVDPAGWALPSTLVAAGVGAALQGTELPALGVDLCGQLRGAEFGAALFAVAGNADGDAVGSLRVRLWPAGEPVEGKAAPLEPTEAGIAGLVSAGPKRTAESYWASIESTASDEAKTAAATVVSLPVLPGRLATLVAQVDADRVRLYQFHPCIGEHPSSAPDRLRRVEHLQRLLLGGRLDGANALAEELASAAPEDPFAGLLAGYVLLRLGLHDKLPDLVAKITTVAPGLSDAYILRGEYEASRKQDAAASQAFVDAVNAGIPAFGEGLTRLVEGLRANGFVHPRGALVRHLFQRHARGSMWTAFNPRRPLEPGRLVIRGADLGFEG